MCSASNHSSALAAARPGPRWWGAWSFLCAIQPHDEIWHQDRHGELFLHYGAGSLTINRTHASRECCTTLPKELALHLLSARELSCPQFAASAQQSMLLHSSALQQIQDAAAMVSLYVRLMRIHEVNRTFLCMQSEAVQRLAFAPTAMTAGYGYLAAGGQNSSVSPSPSPALLTFLMQSRNSPC